MSSKGEQTKKTILKAAWHLLASGGTATLGDIAEEAGVSRQAIYLHFGSRGGLLMELVQFVDDSSGLPALIQRIFSATTPRDQLDEYQRVSAEYCPVIHDVAMALDRARAGDEDVAAAYEDRMVGRREALRAIITAVDAAGELRPGWTVDQVTDAIWSAGTPRAYEELVRDRGWTDVDYKRWLLHVSNSFLANRGDE